MRSRSVAAFLDEMKKRHISDIGCERLAESLDPPPQAT